MKKIRLTETDLENIVRRVLEQETQQTTTQQTTYGQCNGTNEIAPAEVLSAIKYRNDNKTIPDSVSFRITANFGATKSSDQVYKEALIELKKQIDTKLAESKIIGNYEYNLVKVTKIIGTASNYYNGALKPTNYNSGSAIPSDKLNKEPYVNLPGEGDSNWNKNMGFAKNRWTNMLNYIRKNGSSLGFKVDSSLSDPSDIQSWIRDTGGCIDEKRDITKYEIPGQSVMVGGTMKLEPIPLTPGQIDKLIECADGLRIVVGYFNNSMNIDGIDFPKNTRQHTCEFATFDIYCGSQVIGVANMNNTLDREAGWNQSNTNIGKDEPGYHAPTEKGGTVYTVFDIPTEKLKPILSSSLNGKIAMRIKGNDKSLKREGKFHGDAPMVCAFVIDKEGNKRIVYGPQEPFTPEKNSNRPNDVGPEYRFLGSFNPCIEKKVVPA